MSVAWIVGSLCAVGGVGLSAVTLFGEGMSDAPSPDQYSGVWIPAAVGIGLGAAIIGSHYVPGLRW